MGEWDTGEVDEDGDNNHSLDTEQAAPCLHPQLLKLGGMEVTGGTDSSKPRGIKAMEERRRRSRRHPKRIRGLELRLWALRCGV